MRIGRHISLSSESNQHIPRTRSRPDRAVLGVKHTDFIAASPAHRPVQIACSRRLPPAPSHCIVKTPPVGGDLTPQCRNTLAPFRVGTGPPRATDRRAPQVHPPCRSSRSAAHPMGSNHVEAGSRLRQPGNPVHPNHATAPRWQRQGMEKPARTAVLRLGTLARLARAHVPGDVAVPARPEGKASHQ